MNLVFIVGATTTGKTEWALNWAGQEKRAGILNADSIQIYKDIDKGSAKPDFSKYPDIPFYLFNELQAPDICTAGLFRKKALKVLNEKLPVEKIFVVGGSGFYIQALEKGMYPVEPFTLENSIQKKDSNQKLSLSENSCLNRSLKQNDIKNLIEKIDQKIDIEQEKKSKKEEAQLSQQIELNKKVTQKEEEKDFNQLYEELESKDPETAQTISPKDRYRILRALSIMEKENKTLSQIKKEFQQEKLKWPYIKVGLYRSKEDLLKRVTTRTEQMLKEGWIEEVEQFLKRGLKDWRALKSIGYKEIQLFLQGQIKKEDLVPSIISATMKLAKKQKTWFKKDKNIQWFDANLSPLKVYQQLFKP